MWRNFRNLHICNVEKFEITPHVDKFRFLHNFSTWKICLHLYIGEIGDKFKTSTQLASSSFQVKVSLLIPNVYWPMTMEDMPGPASARWFPPWPLCGCWAARRWGSQGRWGRPAKPSTRVSAAPSSVHQFVIQSICNVWILLDCKGSGSGLEYSQVR